MYSTVHKAKYIIQCIVDFSVLTRDCNGVFRCVKVKSANKFDTYEHYILQYSVHYSVQNSLQCTVQFSVQYMYVGILYAVRCL